MLKLFVVVLVKLINMGSKNLKFYGKFLRAMDIQNQDVIRRRGSFVHCHEAQGERGLPGFIGHLKTCQQKRNTAGGRVIRPMISPCGPPSSHETPCLACSWPPITFFIYSSAKSFCRVSCFSSCLRCIFSGKVGFFWRKVQAPKRTYM